MTFKQDNAAFEKWLRRNCSVVRKDLEHKHERMKKDAFVFLRATFFRWAKQIESLCPELARATRVLSVGDTHTENFGTWRDREGRLVWGVNDFDEAAVIAYPFDLVRLVTSARLAPKARVGNAAVAAAILKGYRKGLRHPRPSLLDEQASWMRSYVACTDKEREEFWDEVEDYPTAKPAPPPAVAAALRKNLPPGATFVRFATRVKGGGGLGRPRYVAIAEWRGGQVVREAKALVPSAWDWAHDKAGKPRFLDLARGQYRVPDPHLALNASFVIRRIAPDARKIDLEKLPEGELKADLLEAMGFDIGAIHAATAGAQDRITADLEKRDGTWLHDAARKAAAAVVEDYETWRE
ncbi:hypothetical protein C2U70_00750 [Bradyrhizobium guangdongense]|uniref:DUF2252 family protein n=1 Tax=Bradyrhizobium guangdongense TaxID=1325090 RepID=UPI0011293868|nr:DUF2252 family protein [Bradyrhizobium guangdongense]TPQ42822.1 hypothetical protein C2U70_00750 [Bradyrhizobium guangdongense]